MGTLNCVEDLLREAGIDLCGCYDWSHIGVTLERWVLELSTSRPRFISLLKESGVGQLTERQGLANTLAKACREGRLGTGVSSSESSHENGRPPVPTSTTVSLDSGVGERCQVLLRMQPKRLHTGYVRVNCLLLPVRAKLAPVVRIMISCSCADAMRHELKALQPRVGLQQELSLNAARLLEIGPRFGSSAGVHCLLNWLHEEWDTSDTALVLHPTSPSNEVPAGQVPADWVQPYEGPKHRALDLQVIIPVLRVSQGSRKWGVAFNDEVLTMVVSKWLQGCSYDQWMVLLAFACREDYNSLVMRLMSVRHRGEDGKQDAGVDSSQIPNLEDATQYVDRAVAKATNLYNVLMRRYALDKEQRRKGAMGLTHAERDQLQTRIKYARSRLASLGSSAPIEWAGHWDDR